MLATRNTQSLTEFRQRATETLDRIQASGEAEILTVNGEARAVLLSPAAFDAMARESQVAWDVAVMRQAIDELDSGKGVAARDYFDGLREQLLSRKAASATPAAKRKRGGNRRPRQ